MPLGNQAGGALVEVLVAIFLMTLSIIPVFSCLTYARYSVDGSLHVTMATNLLRDRTETLKHMGYAAMTTGTQVFRQYDPRPGLTGSTEFDLIEDVSAVESMSNSTGASMIKKVVLRIFLHPYENNDLLASWEFLVYGDD